MAFHQHLARAPDGGEELLLVLQTLDENGGAPVDEALGQALVQGIGQLVLDGARTLLPVAGVAQPIVAVGNEGPGSDVIDAGDQGVDVAVTAIQPRDLGTDPVLGQQAVLAHEHLVDSRQEAGMGFAQLLAEIGNLTDLPQQLHRLAGAGEARDLRVPRERQQRQMVVGIAFAQQLRHRRRHFQALDQGARGVERKLRVTPVDLPKRREAVIFDRIDDSGVEGTDAGGGAKGAVIHVAARAAGDLRQLRRRERPRATAVELAKGGEGDMADIHVEPHADGVGGDHVVDLAGLIQRHLGVAGARRERAQHHRRAAALAAHQFGDGVDIGGGKGDGGAARRQPRDLLLTGVGEAGKARPGYELDAGYQPADKTPGRIGAEEHGLIGAARPEQPVGEYMAPLAVGAKLDLIDGEKRHLPVQRHGFDGANEIGRLGREDLFLAGHQRHRAFALDTPHPIVVFPRQQPQRESDHAGPETEHPLDGEVGLAGIGRPQNGDQARTLARAGGNYAHGQRIGPSPPNCKPRPQ